VNRLSLGVQSFDDAELRFLKRDHDAAAARRALELALAAFPRVSFDLIYALPSQTPELWAGRLGAAARLGAEHLSLYQLTLEPGTATTRAAERGLFTPMDDEAAVAFDEVNLTVLGAEGFDAYEVSNFARGSTARSRHNLVYWRGEAYAGVGPGAHGRLQLSQGRTATEAERGVDAYVARVATDGVGWTACEPLDPAAVREERVFMGLRSSEGVAVTELEALRRLHALRRLTEDGWLEVEAGRVRATRRGRILLDRITAELLAG
jgi:coproporphyrinogen III oxidase-like Fe-S oxidoreductase